MPYQAVVTLVQISHDCLVHLLTIPLKKFTSYLGRSLLGLFGNLHAIAVSTIESSTFGRLWIIWFGQTFNLCFRTHRLLTYQSKNIVVHYRLIALNIKETIPFQKYYNFLILPAMSHLMIFEIQRIYDKNLNKHWTSAMQLWNIQLK